MNRPIRPMTTVLLAAGAFAVLSRPVSTHAQAAGQTQELDSMVLEEITVMAQRREQRAQDVPISFTTFSAATIQEYQIDSVNDYAALTPNLGITDGGSPVRQDIAIRGITDFGGSVNAVAVYIDELNVSPTGLNAAFDPSLMDVERIEVLRGPQGTLFGRNAVGGAVNITTTKPGPELQGRLQAEYASFETVELRGSVNVPLSDSLFMRASGFYGESDGFIENRGPAGGSNGYEDAGGRIAFRIAPSEATSIDLSASYTDFQGGLLDQVPTGTHGTFFSALGFPIDPLGIRATRSPRRCSRAKARKYSPSPIHCPSCRRRAGPVRRASSSTRRGYRRSID